jgi:hypothetical protein
MTEREDFLARWSRLKRAGAAASSDPGANGAANASADFDIASLPPIESLTAESDIRPFMQAGVPAQLQQAALRAAWVADPAIRDFIGIADSQWDFNDPTAMPGFGPLGGAENAELFAQRVAQLRTGPATLSAIADRLPQLAGPRRDGQLDRVWLSGAAPQTTLDGVETNSPAAPERAIATVSRSDPQPELAAVTRPHPQLDPQQPPGVRRHGSALPKAT